MVDYRKYPLFTCDLYIGVKITQNVAQYPLHHICTCKSPTDKVEMHLQENILYGLDLGVKVTQNVVQYSPHHVIYATAKFEVAKSNRLGEEAFTRKENI